MINFSVKSLAAANRNFGPRPQEGLIKEKFEEFKDLKMSKKLSNEDANDFDSDLIARPVASAGQVFEMAIDQDNGADLNGEIEVPDEGLPDHRKTQGHF